MRKAIALVALSTTVSLGAQSSPTWPQWGGPTRNFVVATRGLASSWPSGGPRELWSRSLGEGHSAIAADGGRLYTSYRPAGLLSLVRRSQEEVVIALDAASGKTIWEHRYASPTTGVDFSQGAGPHVTPLLTGSLVITAGSQKQILALDKQSGRVIWSHDLIKEFNAPPPGRGYSVSPLSYKDTVIVAGGGPGQAVIALNPKNGAVAWKATNIDVAPASPIVITVDGEDQLIVFGADDIFGLNPTSGAILWSHPHKTAWGLNISTPVWTPQDHLLFVSSAYDTGSRLLQLSRMGGRTTARELWFTNRMRVHFGSVIRLGDLYYGSSGDFGPAFLAAVDAKTGRVVMQERGFARAQLVYADNKLIILDEDGTLALTVVDGPRVKILGRAEVLTNVAWTAPTLVGTKLYLRDRKTIKALELGGTT